MKKEQIHAAPQKQERIYPPLQPNQEGLVSRAYGVASDVDTLSNHVKQEVGFLRACAHDLESAAQSLKSQAECIRQRANLLESQLTKWA